MIRKLAHSLMYFSLVLGTSMVLPAGYTPISVAQADAWYEGGTLHQANALNGKKPVMQTSSPPVPISLQQSIKTSLLNLSYNRLLKVLMTSDL